MSLKLEAPPCASPGRLDQYRAQIHSDQADLHQRLARSVGVSPEKVSNALWIERMQLLELQGGEL